MWLFIINMVWLEIYMADYYLYTIQYLLLQIRLFKRFEYKFNLFFCSILNKTIKNTLKIHRFFLKK